MRFRLPSVVHKNPSSNWRSIIEPASEIEKARVMAEQAYRGFAQEETARFLNQFRYYIPSELLWDENLKGANLSDSYLVGALLGGADLQGADLSRSDLSDADLSGCNLAGAKFTDAIVREVRFTNANLSGADFKGATYDGYTLWPEGFDPVKAGARLVG